MEELNNSDEQLRILFDRDFIFDTDPVSPAVAGHDRATSIRRIKGATIAGAMIVAGVACAGLGSGESSETLPALSTTTEISTTTTVIELPATTSVMVVETTILPREYDCSQDIVIQPGDTLSAIAKACGVGVSELAVQNSIPDPNVLYTNQHIITATTQPSATEAPTTIAVETTVAEIVPAETLPPDTTLPVDTAPPETTLPVFVNDGTYTKAECEKIGTPVEFPAGAGGAWEVIGKYYDITLYQVGRVMKSSLPAEYKINNITASGEYPIYECMPSKEAILAVAPLAAPPTP